MDGSLHGLQSIGTERRGPSPAYRCDVVRAALEEVGQV